MVKGFTKIFKQWKSNIRVDGIMPSMLGGYAKNLMAIQVLQTNEKAFQEFSFDQVLFYIGFAIFLCVFYSFKMNFFVSCNS